MKKWSAVALLVGSALGALLMGSGVARGATPPEAYGPSDGPAPPGRSNDPGNPRGGRAPRVRPPVQPTAWGFRLHCT